MLISNSFLSNNALYRLSKSANKVFLPGITAPLPTGFFKNSLIFIFQPPHHIICMLDIK